MSSITTAGLLSRIFGSQPNFSKISWGILDGRNMSKLRQDKFEREQHETYMLGFHVNGMAALPLTTKVTLRPSAAAIVTLISCLNASRNPMITAG